MLSQLPDFAVLGIPYDLASETDGRLAPELIRRKSLDYPYHLKFEDARPRGWFDADLGERILKSAMIADAGDIRIDHGEASSELGARITRSLRQIWGNTTIPVCIGGDCRVTTIVLENIAQRELLTLVRITADPTKSDAEWQHLILGEYVAAVICVGARSEDYTDPLAAMRLAGCSATTRIYLSIDLGILEARSDGGGPTPTLQDLKALIYAVGERCSIAIIDLVGLNMRRDNVTLDAISACHLALTAMSAAQVGSLR
jgi:hypothetical protein